MKSLGTIRKPVVVAGAPQSAVPPIITKSRGVAYGVQLTYADWHKGIRKRGQ